MLVKGIKVAKEECMRKSVYDLGLDCVSQQHILIKGAGKERFNAQNTRKGVSAKKCFHTTLSGC
jgi:hypothetical protein